MSAFACNANPVPIRFTKNKPEFIVHTTPHTFTNILSVAARKESPPNTAMARSTDLITLLQNASAECRNVITAIERFRLANPGFVRAMQEASAGCRRAIAVLDNARAANPDFMPLLKAFATQAPRWMAVVEAQPKFQLTLQPSWSVPVRCRPFTADLFLKSAVFLPKPRIFNYAISCRDEDHPDRSGAQRVLILPTK